MNGARRHEVKLDARASVSDVSTIHGLAIAGLGAALLPEQLCEDDVARRTLRRLLPGWATSPVHVSAYYPRRRLEPKKVQVFLDYLLEWMAGLKEL